MALDWREATDLCPIMTLLLVKPLPVASMRLQKQLFLTLLLSSALLVGVLFAFNSWSFSRGFSSYVSQRKLAPLIEELAAGFDSSKNWDWLQSEGMVGEKRRLPGPDIPVVWLQLIEKHVLAGQKDDEGKSRKKSPEGRGYQHRLARTALSIMLANETKQPLIGRIPKRDLGWLPIETDSGVVGFVGYRRSSEFQGLLNKAFENQQKRSFAIAAIALALISAAVSFPLASRFVRPISNINNAVGKIRDGDYQVRIEGQRKDELGQLTENINVMAQSLESNQEARQRWIAEISHELRTPLTVLRGELDAMEDGIRPMNGETVNTLQEQTLRLSRLVDDLHVLSMSDLGALDYRFTNESFVAITEGFLAESAATVQKANLTLSTDIADNLPAVRVDKQRIEQLLSNLMQNTLSYTNSEGALKVSLRLAESDAATISEHGAAKSVQLVWADSSPGVTDEQLQRLFDPLYRVESSRSRNTGGAGLGLSIVKKIVEAHEGSITGSHAGAGGLQLTINLPVSTSTIGQTQQQG